MNYMPEIAKMLGVEIGEEFKLNGNYPDIFRLTEKGLEFLYHGKWSSTSSTFNDILGGSKSIVMIPKPILTDKEKKYLSGIIEPWRDEIKSIQKRNFCSNKEMIYFYFYKRNYWYLPSFEKGTEYIGLEIDKEYSLEELGL